MSQPPTASSDVPQAPQRPQLPLPEGYWNMEYVMLRHYLGDKEEDYHPEEDMLPSEIRFETLADESRSSRMTNE